MKLLKIDSLPNNRKQCSIPVTDEFYYLVNKELHQPKVTSGNCSVKEYLGLATLHKRSPKKTLLFLGFAVVSGLRALFSKKKVVEIFLKTLSISGYCAMI